MWDATTIWAVLTSASTVLTGAAAGWERYVNKKRGDAQQALTAKDDTIAAVRENAAEYKQALARKEAELAEYRHETHAKLDKANADVLKLTNECAELRLATDLRPVLKNQEEQSEINLKMLEALDVIINEVRAMRPPECKAVPKKPKPKTHERSRALAG